MAVINNVQLNIQNNVTGSAALNQLDASIKNLDSSLIQLNGNLNKTSKGGTKANKEMGLLAKSTRAVAAGVKAFIAFNISRGLTDLAFNVGASVSEFQKLESVLRITSGPGEDVTNTLRILARVASDLPASTADITRAYVRLNNLNLDNSSAALRDFSDLSAGLGRNLNDLIEAVADASTNEFERLKEEFGIIARQTDKEIRFTFQGTTTTVQKNADAVQNYLRGIASSNFGGAAKAQLDVLSVSFDNLSASIGGAFRRLDAATGSSGFVTDVVNRISRQINISGGSAGIQNYLDEIADKEKIASAQAKRLASDLALVNDEGTGFFRKFFNQFTANDRLGSIATINEQVQELYGNVQRIQDEEAELGRKSLIPGIIQNLANNAFDLEREITKLSEVPTAISKVNDEFARIQLNTPEAALDPKVLESFAELRALAADLDIARASKANAAAYRKEQEALKKLIDESYNAVEQGARLYTDTLEDIKKISDDLVRDQVAGSLAQNLLDTVLGEIGPAILNDGSAQARRALEERNRKIIDAYASLGGELSREIGFIAEITRLDIEAANNALADSLEESTAALLNPFEKIRAELDANTERFRNATNLDAVAQDSANRLKAFAETSEVDFSNIFTAAEAIDAVNLAYSGLAGTDEAKARNLLDFLRELGGSTIAPTTSLQDFRQRAELIADLQRRSLAGTLTDDQNTQLANAKANEARQIAEIQRASSDELFRLLESAEQREFALLQSTASQKVALALSTTSQLTSVYSDRSRKLFEITKALDASTVAMNLYRNLSELSWGSGFLGFFGAAIQATALVAQFAGYIREIDDREFGDSSTNGTGATGPNPSSLRSEVQPQGQNAANVSINVYGSILDEGGFRDAVADGTRQALNNGQLQIRQSDIRRF